MPEIPMDAVPTVVGLAGPTHRALLEQLAIPIVPAPIADRFLLAEVDGLLELRPPDALDRPGIRAEIPPDHPARATGVHPLVRAFGKARMPILDLTAGLGGDACRLAEAGHRVRACEREPALFALLRSGLDAAQRTGRIPAAVAARIELVFGDAGDRLAAIDPVEGGEGAAYLDPMYPPPRRASALPRRELQVLRRLLGPDTDASALLAAARARFERVVVKRPTHAEPLAAGASFVIESKLVRFDVYLDPGRMGRRGETKVG